MSINLGFKGMDVSNAVSEAFKKDYEKMIGLSPAVKVNGVLETTNDPENKFSLSVTVSGDGSYAFTKRLGNDAYSMIKTSLKSINKQLIKSRKKKSGLDSIRKNSQDEE